MKIYYGKAIYDNKEISATIKTLKRKSLHLIDGPSVKKLEKKFSSLFGKRYSLMVNSGSSANLLGLASFNFKKGSEIITPSLTFSTTVSPIYQLGLTPHFIDVEENFFTAKIDQIEKCINKKTVAIMIPNLLGNVPDWKKISELVPKEFMTKNFIKTGLAGIFSAALELSKEGKINIMQKKLFDYVLIKERKT